MNVVTEQTAISVPLEKAGRGYPVNEDVVEDPKPSTPSHLEV